MRPGRHPSPPVGSLRVLLQLPAALLPGYRRQLRPSLVGALHGRRRVSSACAPSPVFSAGSTPQLWPPGSLAATLAASAARPAKQQVAHTFLLSAAGMWPAALSAKPEPLHCQLKWLQAINQHTARVSTDSNATDTLITTTARAGLAGVAAASKA